MTPTLDDLIFDLRSNDRKIRVNAVKSLGRSGARDAHDALCQFLETETDANLRSLTLKALGKLGFKDAIPVLLDNFGKQQDVVITALLRLGVFDAVLPKTRRQRHLVIRALWMAKPDLKNLVAENRLTEETLYSVLPPIL